MIQLHINFTIHFTIAFDSLSNSSNSMNFLNNYLKVSDVRRANRLAIIVQTIHFWYNWKWCKYSINQRFFSLSLSFGKLWKNNAKYSDERWKRSIIKCNIITYIYVIGIVCWINCFSYSRQILSFKWDEYVQKELVHYWAHRHRRACIEIKIEINQEIKSRGKAKHTYFSRNNVNSRKNSAAAAAAAGKSEQI